MKHQESRMRLIVRGNKNEHALFVFVCDLCDRENVAPSNMFSIELYCNGKKTTSIARIR